MHEISNETRSETRSETRANEPNLMITPDILERILSEREARHKAEIDKVRAELLLQSLESRIKKLEDEAEQEEPEQGIGGFKTTDIVQAVMTYLSMQQNSK